MSMQIVRLEFTQDPMDHQVLFIHNGEQRAFKIPKTASIDGRNCHDIDNVFRIVRQVIGERIFPRDTVKWSKAESGDNYEPDGYYAD